MPERAFSRPYVRPVLATALAAAALFGLHRPASAECLETPDPRYATEPGRWVYHVDRATHHKCWHRISEAATAVVQPEAPAPAPAAPVDQSPSSLWSRVYNGLSSLSSSDPQSQQYQQQYQQYQQQYQQYQQQYQYQQYQAQAADPAAALQGADRLRRRTVHRDRPPQEQPPQQQHEPARPVTSGVAPAGEAQAQTRTQTESPFGPGLQSQTQVQSGTPPGEDRHDVPLDVADREALFQDFMKWQLERSMFGR